MSPSAPDLAGLIGSFHRLKPYNYLKNIIKKDIDDTLLKLRRQGCEGLTNSV